MMAMRSWITLLLLTAGCTSSASIRTGDARGDGGAEKPPGGSHPGASDGGSTTGSQSNGGSRGVGAAARGGSDGGAQGTGGTSNAMDSGAGGSSPAGGTGGNGSPAMPVPAGAIVGFGVDGQPRNWGTNGAAVKPALDMLVKDLGANFFRVELSKGQSSWEQDNDDADPNHFAWDKYDAIFASKDFRDLFDYVRYLNGLGVPEIALAVHGLVPAWMGGQQIAEDKEDEFVESILAVLVYARTRAPEPRPQFTLISPWNETNLGPPEGVTMAVGQGVRLLHKLATRMDAVPELKDIAIQAPDASTEYAAVDWSQQLTKDAAVRGRLRGLAFHRYGAYAATVNDWSGSEPPAWLTEFNDWAGYCYVASWGNAMALAGNLIGALEGGVTAGLVWTDYDAPHSHDNDNWETFGLLGASFKGDPDLCAMFGSNAPSQAQLDQLSYAPKPTYQAAKHAFRYIARGAVRRGVSTSAGALHVVAFKNPDGSSVVFGQNTGASGTFTIRLTDGTLPGSTVPWVSTDGSYQRKLAAVALANGSGDFPLPGDSVFTLVSAP